MTLDLRARYRMQLDLVDRIMSDELAAWEWHDLAEAERIIRDQLARKGKQLRPLLTMSVCDALGGRLESVCAPAASVEFYHLAALVLDDVEDNSPVRRGAPTVHTTSTTSMAINIASTIRSLAYHPIHRCETLSAEEKLGLHHELDEAATKLVLGQSIDIGWHLGWYSTHAEFPYDSMLDWKTGAMFGCAAAMGARVAGASAAGASAAILDAVRRLGVSLGALYQVVDDYLDIFGDGSQLRRPKYEDFRGRKMSGPVVELLRELRSGGRDADVEHVLAVFTGRVSEDGWGWLVDLMCERRIGEIIRDQISERTSMLAKEIADLFPDGDQSGLLAILDVLTAASLSTVRTADG
jgi:octaprenyl-diphosphate synthase